MALFDIKTVMKSKTLPPENIIKLIRRRRLQIIVHSCIYYRLNDNLITDAEYDRLAKELANLHKKYGVVKINCYDEYFVDWVTKPGITYSGFNLPIGNSKIIALAESLRKTHYEYKKIQ